MQGNHNREANLFKQGESGCAAEGVLRVSLPRTAPIQKELDIHPPPPGYVECVFVRVQPGNQ